MNVFILTGGACCIYAATVVRVFGGRWLAYRVLVKVLLWIGIALLALALLTSHVGVT